MIWELSKSKLNITADGRPFARKQIHEEISIFFAIFLVNFLAIVYVPFQISAANIDTLTLSVGFFALGTDFLLFCVFRFKVQNCGKSIVAVVSIAIQLTFVIEITFQMLSEEIFRGVPIFLCGFVFCFSINLAIIGRLDWWYLGFLFCSSGLHFLLKANNLDFISTEILIWGLATWGILYLFSVLLINIETRLEKRNEKISELEISEKMAFKKILAELVTQPVIIAQITPSYHYDEYFINQAAHKIFKSNLQLNLEKIFQRLQQIPSTYPEENRKDEIKKDETSAVTSFNKDFSKSLFELLNKNMMTLKAVGNDEILGNFEFDEKGVYQIKYLNLNTVQRTFALIFNDISNEVKIKQLEQSVKSKDHLISTATHDLRTPLGCILGLLEIAKEKLENNEKVAKKLSLAINTAKNFQFIVNDLLDFSSLEKININKEKVLVYKLVEDVLELFKYQTKKRDLELIFDFKCDANQAVFADPIRLQRILFNLLGNALKFTNQGYIKITIENKEFEASSNHQEIPSSKKKKQENIPCLCYLSTFSINSQSCDISKDFEYDNQQTGCTRGCIQKHKYARLRNSESYIIITVEDTGKGILQKDADRLFKFYGRLEDDENVNKYGMGIGLVISQMFAKLMVKDQSKGGITLKSELGKGSSFSFLLESWDESFEIQKAQLTKLEKLKNLYCLENPNKMPSLKKKRILIVDDDPVSLLVINQFFKKIGTFHIESANNGEDCLMKIEKSADKKYDLILIDSKMPIMNGEETIKILSEKLLKGELLDATIIGLTGSTESSEIGKLKQAGAKEVLNKPISFEEFRLFMSKFCHV